MPASKIIKKIKKYSIISFILPLLAINSCLLFYQYMGDLKINEYPNLNWDQDEHTYTFEEYKLKTDDRESHRFMFCPKHIFFTIYTSTDNQILIDGAYDIDQFPDLKNVGKSDWSIIKNLRNNNKIKSITIKKKKVLNASCIKNHQAYSLIRKYSWLDKILTHAKANNAAGFTKIKNPYFYGEVSISRTARFYPSTYIFKPLVIFSAITLFIYWLNNFFLFNKLNKIGVLSGFSKKFVYFGSFSCIFLILHASFLGLEIESEILTKIRRLIIILFIIFEICGQFFLTKNLFQNKKKLEKYTRPMIIKIKVLFISLVLVGTLISASFLIWGDVATATKNILEWNYFSLLLIYYFLSRLVWR